MKILHTADIHLGSKMDSKFPKEISQLRKSEVRNTFKRMVAYAAANEVAVILLAGDLFDSDHPFKKDKEFFYSVVRSNPQIDFLYLRGNHDEQGFYEGDELPNLKTFSDSWQSYRYGNVAITAIEITPHNATSLYSTLSLNGSDVNLLMLHGQVGESMGKDKIQLSKLREKNIDYLALGHIHKFVTGKIDGRGSYACCGCPEGRGFDETGEKGFVLLHIERGVTATFVPFAERKLVEQAVDISGIAEGYAASRRVKEMVKFDRKQIYRVILTGEVSGAPEDLAADVQKYLAEECFFLDVKDCTKRKVESNTFDGDLSLRGEFVRLVCDSELAEDEKARILAYGLAALEGRGIEE